MQYWNNHRLTPKLFLPLAMGSDCSGSRFGKDHRIAFQHGISRRLRMRLQSQLMSDVVAGEGGTWLGGPTDSAATVGGSRGTTPFDGLFLALSFFVIFAAVMLIAMLFRLGLVQRMRQYGMLLAVGWSPPRVARLGDRAKDRPMAFVGCAAGIGGRGGLCRDLVLWALRSWWVGAVTVPFLTFHWSIRSLLDRGVGGMVGRGDHAVDFDALVAQERRPVAALAARDRSEHRAAAAAANDCGIAAAQSACWPLVIAGCRRQAGGQVAAGAFVGGGMMLLIAAWWRFTPGCVSRGGSARARM